MTRPLGALALAVGSVRLYARHFGLLFPLAFAPALALALATYTLGFPADAAMGAPDAPGPALALLATGLNLVAGFVVTGLMCLAALDGALGKRHTLGEYLSQTLRHAGAVVVLGTLLSIATALGVLLAVIPGLYIAARWLPWAQAILFEDLGWSGLGRAQQLTEGNRWALVGALVLMAVPVAVILFVSGVLLVGAGGSGFAGALIEGAATAVYYGLVACFTALAYLRLREASDGLDAAAVAETID